MYIPNLDYETCSGKSPKFLGSIRSVNELPKSANDFDVYYIEDVDKVYIYQNEHWFDICISNTGYNINSETSNDMSESLRMSRIVMLPHKTLISDFMYEKYIDKYIFERYDDIPDVSNYIIGDLILVLNEPIIEKTRRSKHVVGYTNNMYVNGGDHWVCLSADSIVGTTLIFGECKRRWTNKMKPELII